MAFLHPLVSRDRLLKSTKFSLQAEVALKEEEGARAIAQQLKLRPELETSYVGACLRLSCSPSNPAS